MDSVQFSEADEIARVACQHFKSCLSKKGKPELNKWTTFAAIVKKYSKINSDFECVPKPDHNNYTVVSIGTGTKCLGQNELSPDLVSDSHAEVLARRAFLLYLYNQIEQTLEGNEESIFNLKISDDSDSGKYFVLLPNVSFHLFISHLPCGDAAIIPLSELIEIPDQKEDEEGPSKSKKQKLSGSSQCRTGAKLEVGPLVYENVQTVGKCRVKPGKGDPTLCMSCSDKIAKWHILGLQGSLLGNFIPEPIRLFSVIIGSTVSFSQESLERALYSRVYSIINDEKLVSSFDSDFLKGYLKPVVAQASVNFMDLSGDSVKNKNPSPGSVVWNLEKGSNLKKDCGVQVIVNGRKQGATKKNFGKPSAMVDICRKKLFSRFVSLYKLLTPKEKLHFDILTYSEAKKLNNKYLSRWNSLKTKVLLGWTVKPESLMQFCQDLK